MASKSYIIGLGLAEGFLTVEEAAQAAHVEVQSQIERWGEVEDSESGKARLGEVLCGLMRCSTLFAAHDVDHQDIRVRLGSSAIIMAPLPVQ